MNPEPNPTESKKPRQILVAGDICLDVVGVPQPPQGDSECAVEENWRLTGEVRTHLLPGGAMLLAEFVRSAIHAGLISDAVRAAVAGKKDAEEIRRATVDARRDCASPGLQVVRGPMPVRPDSLVAPKGAKAELSTVEFLEIAERLTPRDVVHSLLAAKPFPVTPEEKKKKVLRVEKCHGFSGPDCGEPTLVVVYPAGDPADVVVLDDTGNRFRKGSALNAWPREIVEPGARKPLIVYKLHRPLPAAKCPNALWELVTNLHARNRVVVVAVEDLRKAGAPISLGLSWERTALDVVWHLMNNEAFAQLRDCPRLIVRLGLEGAVVWQRRAIQPMTEAETQEAQKLAEKAGKKTCEPRPEWEYNAWLVYDPTGIEGSLAAATPGSMVACGSAFTAAMATHLSGLPTAAFEALRDGGPVWEKRDEEATTEIQHQFMEAVEAGLHAARRILARGFGDPKGKPSYPGPEIFELTGGNLKYARHEIPIIPDASTPDRGYWRLLESLFDNRTALLHTAVANVAVGKKVKSEPLPWKKAELTQLNAIRDEEARKKMDTAHAAWLLEAAPKASYGKLLTYDRREIEQYRSLYTLLRDYLQNPNPERPLSFAVFGPPGAGKSFGVNDVAASLKGQIGCKEVESITFNLSLYQSADDLAAAFHLVRDKALEGKVPLVFFDEFDTALKDKNLGWLRCFLAPMQDGKFLDRGSEHPIGPAIFVFAGGTCGTFKEFNSHANMTIEEFKGAKGPDFLSRLRATLDIPSLNLPIAAEPALEDPANPKRLIQPPGTFNAYGPTEDFPSTPSILLRRANILAFNLKKKAPGLEQTNGSLHVDAAILRTLLLLPEFNHGNRSFEAILDMSHLAGADHFTAALLPAPAQLPLHANAEHFLQLLAVEFPMSAREREWLGKDIHASYVAQRKAGPPPAPDDESLKDWDDLADYLKESSRQQADDYANKLRTVGLWFRKLRPGQSASPLDPDVLEKTIEILAKREHDRFVAERRRKGWAAAPTTAKTSRDNYRLLHNCLFHWAELDEPTKDLDRTPMRSIPEILAKIDYEVYRP